MELNPEQLQAVRHFKGPCIVTATPGSGKTFCITERVVILIRDHKVDPKNILCTTFTNKAANEMQERVAKQIGTAANSVFINTFHGLCLAILRKYGSLVGLANPFSIYAEKEQTDLLSKIARMHEHEISSYGIKELARIANNFREDTTETFEKHIENLEPVEVDIIKEYLDLLDQLNAVDFSGILYKCWLLLKNEKVVNVLSERFQFIQVDESQDMNSIQYDITKMIGKHGNIMFVGDTAQAIFSFRGANPENLEKVPVDFPDVTQLTLPRNYRSTSRILAAAQRLIRHNDNAKNVELISVRGDGEDVKIDDVFDDQAESDLVASRINYLRRTKNYKYKDFAVLYRVNKLSRTIEMTLRANGIPYKVIGGFSFFDRKEIKTALAYLSFYVNPNDTIAFSRAISEPKRNVGSVAIGRLERMCQQQKISMLEACDRIDGIDGINGISVNARESINNFVELINKHRELEKQGTNMTDIASGLLKCSGYYNMIEKVSEKDQTEAKRIENLNELLKGIEEYRTKKPESTIGDYLQSVQIMTSDALDAEDDAVALQTIHSSKGLQYPVVFAINCSDGVVPHYMNENISEERRLFYVCISRSADFLFLTRPKIKQEFAMQNKRNKINRTNPSPFLFELDPNYSPM